MVRLTKSYRLLRFLNGQPSAPVRVAIGVFAAGLALLFSLNFRVASLIWCGVLARGGLKTALRRLAWISARSRWGFVALHDPVFDFAKGLSTKDIAAMERFLAVHGREDLRTQLDHLTLQASKVQFPLSLKDWQSFLDRFGKGVDEMLHGQGHMGAVVDPVRKGDFPLLAAQQALADFDELFPQDKLPWFVISGTFLGIVRENGFLTHDYDIDLGVFADQVDLETITNAVASSDKFRVDQVLVQDTITTLLVDQIDCHETPVLIKLLHQDGVHLDIFLHFNDNGTIWHGSDLHRWENSAFDLAAYQLAGINVAGPADFDRYLRENYGDWRTPVTSFNASTGTPNLRMVHNLRSFVLFLKRYAYAKESGSPDADHVAQIMLDQGYLVHSKNGLKFVADRFIPAPSAARVDRHSTI